MKRSEIWSFFDKKVDLFNKKLLHSLIDYV